jgi:hypothetical protein
MVFVEDPFSGIEEYWQLCEAEWAGVAERRRRCVIVQERHIEHFG